jgi:hypothetical protein
MCGRYRLSRRKQLVEEYFDASGDEDWSPRSVLPNASDAGGNLVESDWRTWKAKIQTDSEHRD